MPSVKFGKKPVLSNSKAFLLMIDTSIILNWLLREINLSTKNCIFCNAEYIYSMHYIGTIHPSGVVFKGVLECQIRNSLSARK